MCFYYPELMKFHIDYLIDYVKSYENNLPVILIGDFNTQPDHQDYKYFNH